MKSPNKTRSSFVEGSPLIASYLDGRVSAPFSAKQEREEARALWEARCERWAVLLSYPPLVPGVRARIDEELELEPELSTLLDELTSAATAFRRHRTLANERELERLCRAASEPLVEADTRARLAEALVADVERIAAGEREGLQVQIARLPHDSRPFRVFHARVRESQSRLRRRIDVFARANLRLVVSLAGRFARNRIPITDAIQEGNIGLLMAIDRFDYRKGFRFSTYAAWWIRHAISRAVYNTARQVRIPVHLHDLHHRVARTRREFAALHGREPTREELAEATGVRPAKLAKLAALDLGPALSLDAPVTRDGCPAVELLEDEEACSFAATLEREQLESELDEALEELPPMEIDILRHRYGLEGAEPQTLAEIGERYALSRERIRQLQAQAVGRVRGSFERAGLV
jgi:RNA polymerase primary sigma factor